MSHKPFQYGNTRNTQWREGGSSDRREYPGAIRHARQDTEPSEWQRAEEKRRAQVEYELQQVQRRREEEEYAERVRKVAQRRREEEERRNAKKKAKNEWRAWIGERDDFAGARSSMAAFARCSALAGKGEEPRAALSVALSQISSDLQQKIFLHHATRRLCYQISVER